MYLLSRTLNSLGPKLTKNSFRFSSNLSSYKLCLLFFRTKKWMSNEFKTFPRSFSSLIFSFLWLVTVQLALVICGLGIPSIEYASNRKRKTTNSDWRILKLDQNSLGSLDICQHNFFKKINPQIGRAVSVVNTWNKPSCSYYLKLQDLQSSTTAKTVSINLVATCCLSISSHYIALNLIMSK